MMRNTQQLGRWLMREVHGIDVPRKPARTEHGGGPARNWTYKRWIRSLPCAICGLEPCGEAAHTGGDGGMAMKASDYSCIPLCPACHTFGPESYHVLGRGPLCALPHGKYQGRLLRRGPGRGLQGRKNNPVYRSLHE